MDDFIFYHKKLHPTNGFVTYEPTEHFEPFAIGGLNCGIVTNSTRQYIRIIDETAGKDGEIGWVINAAGDYAANKEKRDKYRPIVAQGLAAQLVYQAKFVRGVWRVNADAIATQYRRDEQGQWPFSDVELQRHLAEEAERWRETQENAKRWLPRDLYDIVHRSVESYCCTRLIDPDVRDKGILDALHGDTSKYESLIEAGSSARTPSDLGRAVAAIIKDSNIVFKSLVKAMTDSGKFAQLNGKSASANYATMHRAANR